MVDQTYCQFGTCYVSSCQYGFAKCGYPWANTGCETDIRSDPKNCGSCGITCGLTPGSSGVCKDGACIGECPFPYGDCTPDLGCETVLTTPENCGACGRPACDLKNVDAPCNGGVDSVCAGAICAVGYGDCDTTTHDCEASFGSAAATCFPKYRHTDAIQTSLGSAGMAVGADGTRFLAGWFTGSVDFDPTAGVDMQTGRTYTPYLTRLNSNGTYGWTKTFVATGDSGVNAVAATADGGVVIVGGYQGIIDLDPGSGTSYHASASGETFIARLASDGSLVWGRTLGTTAYLDSAPRQTVAVASDGTIILRGEFGGGTVDFDPGPGVVERSAYNQTTYLLKLTGAGDFVWVQTWDMTFTPNCSIVAAQFTVSPSGAVWGTGQFQGTCDFDPGPGFDLRSATATYGQSDGFAIQLAADGTLVGVWTFPATSDSGVAPQAIAVDASGAVYIGGTFSGVTDFDPGPGDATRKAPNGSGFVLKLDASGALSWVALQSDFAIRAIGVTKEGTAIAVGSLGYGYGGPATLVAVPGNGNLGWTMSIGSGDMRVIDIVVTPTALYLEGFTYSSDADFDPGDGVDYVSSYSAFVTELRF